MSNLVRLFEHPSDADVLVGVPVARYALPTAKVLKLPEGIEVGDWVRVRFLPDVGCYTYMGPAPENPDRRCAQTTWEYDQPA